MSTTIDSIKNITVIGAGAMGRQIAMTAALAGYQTTVQDISQDMLDAASAEMSGWAESRVAKGKLEQSAADAALGNLAWETDLERAAANADFVIEAATERLDIKRGSSNPWVPSRRRTRFWPPTPRPSVRPRWPRPAGVWSRSATCTSSTLPWS